MDGLTLGRIVHYVVHNEDVAAVQSARANSPRDVPKGLQVRVGNPLIEGDHLPMMITAVFPHEFGNDLPGINGQVFLDGTDLHWVTSIRYSDKKEPGTWHWIEKV